MPRQKQAQWVCQRIQAGFLHEVMEVPRVGWVGPEKMA